uniref:Myb/SANT-like DNA-binding domain-containing protein n=1 Tax=Myripristis murdjan TaxID=586833 RepID=A0A667X2R8_9TELE
MSGVWREEDDEEYKVGGRGGSRSKPRFSFTEIKLLLEEVKRNRYIILKKFNHGVSAETKKQTWAEITEQINDLGENRREVRQIMKKWADLKCDGKRRMAALRGPNGSNLRKKNLGPVERMVHKILLMSPGTDIDSDLDFGEDDEEMAKCRRKVPPPTAFSYLNMTDTSSLPLPGGASFDLSPLSSPEKDLSGDPFHSSPDFEFDMAEDGDRTMDFDDDDDMFSYRPSLPPPSSSVPLDPLPDDALLRNKPVHTYSRNNSNTNHHPTHSQTLPRPASGPSSSSSVFPSTADSDAASSSVNAPQSPCNTITNTNGSPSSLIAPPSSSSSSLAPPRPTSPLPSPPSLHT